MSTLGLGPTEESQIGRKGVRMGFTGYQSPRGDFFVLMDDVVYKVPMESYKEFFLRASVSTNQPEVVSLMLDLRSTPEEIQDYTRRLIVAHNAKITTKGRRK